MVLCIVISFVENAFFPVDYEEVALVNTVSDPKEAHVNGFRPFLFDSVVGDTRCSAVVGLNRFCRLRMTEFFEACAKRAGFFSIVKEGGEFGFGGAGEYFF